MPVIMKENVQYAYTDKGIKAHTLSYAEYQALSTEEKMNGDLYFIPDKQPEGNPSLIWDKLGTATLDTDADNVSDAVNEINSNLTYKSITIPSSYINSKITVNKVFGGVCGGVAEFYLQGVANASIAVWEALVTALPNELKPRETSNAYFININNTAYICNLNPDGLLNTPQTISNGQIIRFKATYIPAVV